MCHYNLFLACFINVLPSITSLEGDIFCSSEHLRQALLEGNHVLRQVNIRNIPNNKTREKINRIKFDLGFYESLSDKWTDGIARHPIYIYSMVRDLFVLRRLKSDLPKRINVDDLPNKEDLEGTLSALVRLQYTYDLKVDDMAAGIIASERSTSLSAQDCLLIGTQAHKIAKYSNAISWLNHALAVNSTRSKSLKAKIYFVKCKCEFKIGARKDALKSINNWLKNDKESTEAKAWRDKILQMREMGNHKPVSASMNNYTTLCRGEMTKEYNVTMASKLYCRFYDNDGHPLLILQPARQEDVRDDPYIKIYRDVISDRVIDTIKSFAKPKLKVTKVMKKSGSKVKPVIDTDSRISKGHFITSSDPVYIKLRNKLHKRVQAITGFYSKSYEVLQVANYGIGGHYFTHYDWSEVLNSNLTYNDRIGTFLFYLNDVVSGGATVFPRIGVRVTAEKGDAVFWHNLHRNGLGNKNTFHAGCPVLLGTKWIANLWIRRYHNEFSQPCTLNEFE